jgi:surface antigen
LNALDIAKITKQAAKDAAREAFAEQDGTRTYQSELRDANKICREYAESVGATKEQVDAAFAEMESYGIEPDRLGGPTARARILINELNSIMRESHVTNRVTEAERIAAEKTRKLALTRQPGGGGAPATQPKTSQREALAGMKVLGGKGLNDLK